MRNCQRKRSSRSSPRIHCGCTSVGSSEAGSGKGQLCEEPLPASGWKWLEVVLVKCVQGDAAQGDSAWQMTAAAPHSIVECLTLGPLSAAISTRAGLSSALQTHWELMSSLSQKHGWERIITDVTDHRLRTFAEYNPTKGPKLYYINPQQPLRPHYLQALLNGTLTVPHGYPDYYYKDLLSGRISCLA